MTETRYDLEVMESSVWAVRSELESARDELARAKRYAADGVHRGQIDRAAKAVDEALSSLSWVQR